MKYQFNGDTMNTEMYVFNGCDLTYNPTREEKLRALQMLIMSFKGWQKLDTMVTFDVNIDNAESPRLGPVKISLELDLGEWEIHAKGTRPTREYIRAATLAQNIRGSIQRHKPTIGMTMQLITPAFEIATSGFIGLYVVHFDHKRLR